MHIPRAATLALLMVAACAVVAVAPWPAEDEFEPTRVDGLVAWYSAQWLHHNHRNGRAVNTWEDTSGNGHDLVRQGEGPAGVFWCGRRPLRKTSNVYS